jgi:hypothetical protein
LVGDSAAVGGLVTKAVDGAARILFEAGLVELDDALEVLYLVFQALFLLA